MIVIKISPLRFWKSRKQILAAYKGWFQLYPEQDKALLFHMEAADCVLASFDLYWFRSLILRRRNLCPPTEDIIPPITVNSVGAESLSSEPPRPISTSFRLLHRHRRSRSDELAPIPTLRIQTAKLQTIFSGKMSAENPFPVVPHSGESRQRKVRSDRDQRGVSRRRKKGKSKSLSDLEFEELKGLMDLGFMFSEAEAADPHLNLIVPGLQRLRRAVGNGVIPPAEISLSAVELSRPYLSEAWDTALATKERGNNVLKNWRIPPAGKGVDFKDHLRLWAHSVAYAVR